MTMEILNDFNINVVDESPIYRVEYSLGNYTGSCTYTETRPQSKLQSGSIYLLTHSDMGDVIEYINADEEKLNWHEWLKSLGYDIAPIEEET